MTRSACVQSVRARIPEDCIDVIAMDVEIVGRRQAARQKSSRRIYLRYFALHVLCAVPGSMSNLLFGMTQDLSWRLIRGWVCLESRNARAGA